MIPQPRKPPPKVRPPAYLFEKKSPSDNSEENNSVRHPSSYANDNNSNSSGRKEGDEGKKKDPFSDILAADYEALVQEEMRKLRGEYNNSLKPNVESSAPKPSDQQVESVHYQADLDHDLITKRNTEYNERRKEVPEPDPSFLNDLYGGANNLVLGEVVYEKPPKQKEPSSTVKREKRVMKPNGESPDNVNINDADHQRQPVEQRQPVDASPPQPSQGHSMMFGKAKDQEKRLKRLKQQEYKEQLDAENKQALYSEQLPVGAEHSNRPAVEPATTIAEKKMDEKQLKRLKQQEYKKQLDAENADIVRKTRMPIVNSHSRNGHAEVVADHERGNPFEEEKAPRMLRKDDHIQKLKQHSSYYQQLQEDEKVSNRLRLSEHSPEKERQVAHVRHSPRAEPDVIPGGGVLPLGADAVSKAQRRQQQVAFRRQLDRDGTAPKVTTGPGPVPQSTSAPVAHQHQQSPPSQQSRYEAAPTYQQYDDRSPSHRAQPIPAASAAAGQYDNDPVFQQMVEEEMRKIQMEYDAQHGGVSDPSQQPAPQQYQHSSQQPVVAPIVNHAPRVRRSNANDNGAAGYEDMYRLENARKEQRVADAAVDQQQNAYVSYPAHFDQHDDAHGDDARHTHMVEGNRQHVSKQANPADSSMFGDGDDKEVKKRHAKEQKEKLLAQMEENKKRKAEEKEKIKEEEDKYEKLFYEKLHPNKAGDKGVEESKPKVPDDTGDGNGEQCNSKPHGGVDVHSGASALLTSPKAARNRLLTDIYGDGGNMLSNKAEAANMNKQQLDASWRPSGKNDHGQRDAQLEQKRLLQIQMAEDVERKKKEKAYWNGEDVVINAPAAVGNTPAQEQPSNTHVEGASNSSNGYMKDESNKDESRSPSKIARDRFHEDMYGSVGRAMAQEPDSNPIVGVEAQGDNWMPSGKNADEKTKNKRAEQKYQLEQQMASKTRQKEEEKKKLKDEDAALEMQLERERKELENRHKGIYHFPEGKKKPSNEDAPSPAKVVESPHRKPPPSVAPPGSHTKAPPKVNPPQQVGSIEPVDAEYEALVKAEMRRMAAEEGYPMPPDYGSPALHQQPQPLHDSPQFVRESSDLIYDSYPLQQPQPQYNPLANHMYNPNNQLEGQELDAFLQNWQRNNGYHAAPRAVKTPVLGNRRSQVTSQQQSSESYQRHSYARGGYDGEMGLGDSMQSESKLCSIGEHPFVKGNGNGNGDMGFNSDMIGELRGGYRTPQAYQHDEMEQSLQSESFFKYFEKRSSSSTPMQQPADRVHNSHNRPPSGHANHRPTSSHGGPTGASGYVHGEDESCVSPLSRLVANVSNKSHHTGEPLSSKQGSSKSHHASEEDNAELRNSSKKTFYYAKDGRPLSGAGNAGASSGSRPLSNAGRRVVSNSSTKGPVAVEDEEEAELIVIPSPKATSGPSSAPRSASSKHSRNSNRYSDQDFESSDDGNGFSALGLHAEKEGDNKGKSAARWDISESTKNTVLNTLAALPPEQLEDSYNNESTEFDRVESQLRDMLKDDLEIIQQEFEESNSIDKNDALLA